MASAGLIPVDDEEKPVLALWNDATGMAIPVHVKSTVTGADGKVYAILDTGTSGGGTQYTDGGTPPANPVGTVLVYDNSGVWVDVGADHPLPISGTISATNPFVSTDGNPIPGSSTLIGGSDGTNLQPLQVDGSKNLKVVQQGNITEANSATIQTNTANTSTVLGGTGDAAVTGDNTGSVSGKLRGLTKILADIWDSVNHRIKVDGSGVTQPVSGTVTANAGTNLNTSTLALEAGGNLATIAGVVSSNKAAVKSTASGDFVDGSIVAIGTTTQAKATDGTTTSWSVIQLLKGILDRLFNGTIAVTGTFWQATQPVSGTVTANAGTNLNTSLLALEAGGNLATLVTNTADLLADGDNLATIQTNTANIPAKGQATMVNSLPVTMASDQTPKVTATATKTNIAASTSDTSILASNTSRKGGKMYNDSTAICYLSEGSGAASTTSYTTQIPANGLYEIPPEPIYTGAYRAVWSAANGNLRVTENT